MSTELFFTNIGFTISVLVSLGAGVSVYLKGKDLAPNKAFFFLMLAVGIFQTAHVVGINISDPALSRFFLMFTVATIFTACFTAQLVFAVLGELSRRKADLIVMYAIAISLVLFFVSRPETFLLNSSPKLYLPNYYVPGDYYWILIAFFGLSTVHFMSVLISALLKSRDPIVRNRLKYFMLSIILGYVAGSSAFFLVYDIPVDPIFAILIGLHTIPLAYGILKYELMDIRVAAKRAFVYAVAVGLVSFIINIINLGNNYFLTRNPNFSPWLLPFFSSIVAVAIGTFVWRKIKEVEALKYEFLTVITHKFRTPLTYIKWSLDELRGNPTPAERDRSVEQIRRANVKLVELTNVLIDMSELDDE